MSGASRYRYLFSPLRIGPVVVRNRIVFSAHLTNYAEDGLPTQQHADYFAARAAGGVGLIITEEHSTHPTDWPYEHAPLAADCGFVVHCGHRLPDEALYLQRPGTLRAGDCVAPRTVLEAVLEARRTAMAISAADQLAELPALTVTGGGR